MTNTETEAKTKWCPFVRVLTVARQNGQENLAPPFNRIALGEKASERDLSPEACRCIASECMSWRWAPVARVALDDEVVGYDKSTTHGYCGLAGAP